MKKNRISKNWINKQRRDIYVRKSQVEGYRARSAYKLIEIDQKFKILKNGISVIDLGAAPGSWSQYIAKIVKSVHGNDPVNSQFSSELSGINEKTTGQLVMVLIISLICLLMGADGLVDGSVLIARNYGISDLVIGLTIVAIGTSLPEIAASITSVIKGKNDIAIGNIIGSNMFNMLAVLGIPTLIQPAKMLDPEIFNRDFLALFILTALLAIMLFSFKKVKLSRYKGAVLLLCFVAYQFFVYQNIIGK